MSSVHKSSLDDFKRTKTLCVALVTTYYRTAFAAYSASYSASFFWCGVSPREGSEGVREGRSLCNSASSLCVTRSWRLRMVWGNQRSRSLFRGTATGKSAGIETAFPGLRSWCAGGCDDSGWVVSNLDVVVGH